MYVLVLAALLHMSTVRPQMVGAFKDMDACLAAASKHNHDNTELQSQTGRDLGAAYVCMKIVYPV